MIVSGSAETNKKELSGEFLQNPETTGFCEDENNNIIDVILKTPASVFSEVNPPFVAEGEIGKVVIEVSEIKNHGDLSGRDLPDQHPISAISGLEEALSELKPELSTSTEAFEMLSEEGVIVPAYQDGRVFTDSTGSIIYIV